MSGLNIERMKKQMKQSAAAIAKIVPNKRLENITKVTFETTSGKTFTAFNARVWKLDLKGNLAYQVRMDGDLDLEEILKEGEVKNDVV